MRYDFFEVKHVPFFLVCMLTRFQSSSETADDETRKDEEGGKQEDKSDKNKGKEKDGSKLPSGASTKGTNTPSGRNKFSDPLKKAAGNLKRPGSPNLSEASGTESARKKSKKQHNTAQATPRTSTPKPTSRPISPAPSSTTTTTESNRPPTVLQQQRSFSANPLVDSSKTNNDKAAKSTIAEKKERVQGLDRVVMEMQREGR